ncbi:sigma-70 family RNA polymerase sigma factor [Mycolicibacterium nivoides]|uniref:sigma-70 family RNA polymerase sigma factor n=1 Tax=Mycolicibacterium nivoides TaxID=2487344 RepID=UPI003C2E0199
MSMAVTTERGEDHVTRLAFAAGRGDSAALEQFIRATQTDVWRTVAYLGDSGSADDLTQETFMRAITALPRFSGRSSARTWLLSIARRVVVDQVGGFEKMVEIRLLLDGLDPDRRHALLLTQVLGLSYAEAAEVCGCPVGTIRSRVARAREDLIAAAERDDLTG